jgi:hypothetical protein
LGQRRLTQIQDLVSEDLEGFRLRFIAGETDRTLGIDHDRGFGPRTDRLLR